MNKNPEISGTHRSRKSHPASKNPRAASRPATQFVDSAVAPSASRRRRRRQEEAEPEDEADEQPDQRAEAEAEGGLRKPAALAKDPEREAVETNRALLQLRSMSWP